MNNDYLKRLLILSILCSTIAFGCYRCDYYQVHYTQLGIDFSYPPLPKDLKKHGTEIKLQSCSLMKIFRMIQNCPKRKDINREEFNLIRIMITDPKDNKRIFITQNKKITTEDLVIYEIDSDYIDKAISDIENKSDFTKAEDKL